MIRNWFSIKTRVPDEKSIKEAFQYALSLCNHHQDAEDFVQQACFQLCRRYGQIKSKGLLFTAVRNLYFDQCRRKKVISFQALEETGDATFEPREGDLTFPANVDLGTLLNLLDPPDRELIYLQYVEGYSAGEIAKLTGQPRGTVLWRLSRAKAELKSFLEAECHRPNHHSLGKESS